MDLLGSATDFLKGVVTKKVKTYDSSKNEIWVSGMKLDGVVTATLSDNVRTSSETGVDKQYYAITETFTTQTLSVTILPTAMCYEQLVTLDYMSQQERAVLPLYVMENGSVVDLFSSHIISLGDRTMGMTSSQRTVTFGVTRTSYVETNIITEQSGLSVDDLGSNIDSELGNI